MFICCRFEKYAVSVESFWELLVARQDGGSQQVLNEVLARCQSLFSALGLSTFYGAVADSTVATALLSVLQNSLPNNKQLLEDVAHGALVRVLVRAVATNLLQIMKPHAFLQQAHAGVHLPASYEAFYSSDQEHYNLKQLLATILDNKPLPSLAFAAECGDNAEEAFTDAPESSAAAEARAVGASTAAQAGLLERGPPSSKWIIFTCTTPDLDMGSILPAGELLFVRIHEHATKAVAFQCQ